jgi:hypothetical protein
MSRRFLTATVVALATLTGNQPRSALAETRTWTDSTGKHKIEAEFIEILEGQVKLQRPDGKRVSLPLAKLSKPDQAYLKEEMKRRRDGGGASDNPFQEDDSPGSAEMGDNAIVRGKGPAGIGGYRIGDRVEVREGTKWAAGEVIGFDDRFDHIQVRLDGSNRIAEAWEGEHWIRLEGSTPVDRFGGMEGRLPRRAREMMERASRGEQPVAGPPGGFPVTPADYSEVNRVVALGSAGGDFKPDPAASGEGGGKPRPVGLAPKPGFFSKTEFISFGRPGAMRAATALLGNGEISDDSSMIEICDLKSGRVSNQLPGPRGLKVVAASPSGKRIATACEVETFTMGPVQVWEVNGKEAKHIIGWHANDDEKHQISWLCWLDENRLLTLDEHALTLWNVDGAKAIYQISGERMSPPAFSPGGKQLSLANGSAVNVHDVDSGELLASLAVEDLGMNALTAFSPSGKQIAVTGTSEVIVGDLGSGEIVLRCYAPAAGAFAKGLAWVNENQILVGGTNLVDIPSKMPIWTYASQATQTAPGAGRVVWYAFDDHASKQRALLPFQLPHPAVKPVSEGELALKPGDEVGIEMQVDDGALAAEAEERMKKAIEMAGFAFNPSATTKLVVRSGPGESEEIKYQDWGIDRETHTVNVNKREYEVSLVKEGEKLWSSQSVKSAPHFIRLQKDETVDQAVQREMKPNVGLFPLRIPSRVLPLEGAQKRVSQLTVAGIQ